MASLKKLSKDMQRLADRIPSVGKELAQVAAKAALTVVANRTPVDTGKAVSNWQVNIGSPLSGEIESNIPGIGGSTEPANRQLVQMEGEVEIATYPGSSSIHISNDASYIGKLNDGWSAKDAGGFVEAAVVAANVAVENTKVNLHA